MISVPPTITGSGLGLGSSFHLLLALFFFFRFHHEFFPKARNLIELGDSSSGGTKGAFKSRFLVDKLCVLRLEGLLLLDALAYQNSEAKGQVGLLAIITLALLLQLFVLSAKKL